MSQGGALDAGFPRRGFIGMPGSVEKQKTRDASSWITLVEAPEAVISVLLVHCDGYNFELFLFHCKPYFHRDVRNDVEPQKHEPDSPNGTRYKCQEES